MELWNKANTLQCTLGVWWKIALTCPYVTRFLRGKEIQGARDRALKKMTRDIWSNLFWQLPLLTHTKANKYSDRYFKAWVCPLFFFFDSKELVFLFVLFCLLCTIVAFFKQQENTSLCIYAWTGGKSIFGRLILERVLSITNYQVLWW